MNNRLRQMIKAKKRERVTVFYDSQTDNFYFKPHKMRTVVSGLDEYVKKGHTDKVIVKNITEELKTCIGCIKDKADKESCCCDEIYEIAKQVIERKRV